MSNKYLQLEDFQGCEMFTLDYYDGPTSGAMLCQSDNRAYRFRMLDWDAKQDVRIFSLASLSGNSFQNFVNALSRFDINDVSEESYLTLKQSLDTNEDDELIIARRNSDDAVLAVKKLSDQDKPDIKDWFSEPTPSRDWFTYLGLSK